MIIEQTSRAVLTVRFPDVRVGWEYWVLLRSDAHHDSVHCNRTEEKRHLDEMMGRGGAWCDFGDLFDAMQGRYDPRRDYADLREEYKGTAYYDLIVADAAQFYEPYAGHCLLLAMGGHETSAEKHTGNNLTSNLAYHLNMGPLRESDQQIHAGAFGGWIRFMFNVNKTKTKQLRLRYLHGGGGNAPVTKGVIQTNRQAVFLPDANIVINGHNHQSYIVHIKRDRLTMRGKQYKDVQWHGRIPGYKDPYADGTGGWEVEHGWGPTPMGALWLHLEYDDRDLVKYTLIPEIR